jgi:hypothetical protein
MSSREQFEAWAKENRPYSLDKSVCDLLGDEVYDCYVAQADWDLWQASRAVPLEFLELAKHGGESCCAESFNDGIRASAAKLEAQGYRVKS